MVKDFATDNYYLFGLVSFGLYENACNGGSYTVFSYLTMDIVDWINEQLLN